MDGFGDAWISDYVNQLEFSEHRDAGDLEYSYSVAVVKK